jgi:hypothetical protein
MYTLWIITILLVLAATFTNFQFEDLNALAIVLLAFALINSFFVTAMSRMMRKG